MQPDFPGVAGMSRAGRLGVMREVGVSDHVRSLEEVIVLLE